jgi:transcriptional regulator with XRE-family HTH domain
MGTKKWSEIRRQRVGSESRARVEEMRRAIRDAIAIGELRELRHGRRVTQEQLAGRMGIGQENVSRIERREDLYLSTLRHYVEALGGQLEVSAVFDGVRIELLAPEEAEEPVAVAVG